jgi:hypothetical protein
MNMIAKKADRTPKAIDKLTLSSPLEGRESPIVVVVEPAATARTIISKNSFFICAQIWSSGNFFVDKLTIKEFH